MNEYTHQEARGPGVSISSLEVWMAALEYEQETSDHGTTEKRAAPDLGNHPVQGGEAEAQKGKGTNSSSYSITSGHITSGRGWMGQQDQRRGTQ